MARKCPSYAWSRHLHVADVASHQLSREAFTGLEYAQQLAKEAPIRSAMNLPRYRPEFAPLTLGDLAETHGVAVSLIGRRIARARRELFGEIGDAAIFKRVQRAAEAAEPAAGSCKEPGCTNPLPAPRHGNLDYCAEHRTPAARTRRHRRRWAADAPTEA